MNSIFNSPKRSRFAPSPTGHLHLGHVLSAAFVWAISESYGAEVLLRMEDHDLIRSRQQYLSAILAELSWLGFMDLDSTRWDPLCPNQQSKRPERYNKALRTLSERGLVYSCNCTRKSLEDWRKMQSVDQPKEYYPGLCRGRAWNQDRQDAQTLRLVVEDQDFSFEDIWHRRSFTHRPHQQCGDFILLDRDGHFSYQLCVVVDDLYDQVDLIVRGDDVIDSTGRQLYLRQQLLAVAKELMGEPALRPVIYAHHPLLWDADGKKLSKRSFAESITAMKKQGLSPERIFAKAAAELGWGDGEPDLSLREFMHLIQVRARGHE